MRFCEFSVLLSQEVFRKYTKPRMKDKNIFSFYFYVCFSCDVRSISHSYICALIPENEDSLRARTLPTPQWWELCQRPRWLAPISTSPIVFGSTVALPSAIYLDNSWVPDAVNVESDLIALEEFKRTGIYGINYTFPKARSFFWSSIRALSTAFLLLSIRFMFSSTCW